VASRTISLYTNQLQNPSPIHGFLTRRNPERVAKHFILKLSCSNPNDLVQSDEILRVVRLSFNKSFSKIASTTNFGYSTYIFCIYTVLLLYVCASVTHAVFGRHIWWLEHIQFFSLSFPHQTPVSYRSIPSFCPLSIPSFLTTSSQVTILIFQIS